MTPVLAILMAVLIVLCGPAARQALANPTSPTRRVYRAIGMETVLIGVAAAVAAFVAGIVLTAVAQATSWSRVMATPSGTNVEPAVWVNLVIVVGLVQLFGVIAPGALLGKLATDGQKRLYPTPSLRALHVLRVFAYLVILGVPFVFAIPYAVTNHLVVTTVLRRMLAGYDPWHIGAEAVVVGAAAREGIAVDWELFKVRDTPIGFAGGDASWRSLPLHGQRAVLVTAATQVVFIWSGVAPIVVDGLLSMVF